MELPPTKLTGDGEGDNITTGVTVEDVAYDYDGPIGVSNDAEVDGVQDPNGGEDDQNDVEDQV